MPNYYIQAKRGTFNPFSFDEYVKPLNMYKEYYERNEEAITDMQEQANLWKNIMESEKDSKLAEKYNTYVNNLNNATQQLKNGMSYNLRNQIQQLRGQSAMVKQIENAYNLRAKDIDAYNELMIKDPSRIGADDPTTRRLQDYLNGPVKNNYGVSGDRLYALGNARAKAMSAQNVNYYNSIMTNGGQYFMDLKTQGFSDEDIAKMLREQDSALYNEASRIMQQEGATFDNQADMDRAVGYTINGMLSGFSYDEDRKYRKNENFMTDIDEKLKNAELENKLINNELNKIKLGSLGVKTKPYFDAISGSKTGYFTTNFPEELNNVFDIVQSLNDQNYNGKRDFIYDPNGNVTTSKIKRGIEINNNLDFAEQSAFDEYYKLSEELKNTSQTIPLDKVQAGTNYTTSITGQPINPRYTEIVNRLNEIKNEYGNDIVPKSGLSKSLYNEYKEYKDDENRINQLKSLCDIYNIPGNTLKEQIDNLYDFWKETAMIKNYGGVSYNDVTELNKVNNVIEYKIANDDKLKLINLEDNDELSKSEVNKILNNGFYAFPSNMGWQLVDKKPKESYLINAASNSEINNFNKDIFGINQIILNPFSLIEGKTIYDAENFKSGNNFVPTDLYDIPNTKFGYYLFKDNETNKIYAHIFNKENKKETNLELYNAKAWSDFAIENIEREADKILGIAISNNN